MSISFIPKLKSHPALKQDGGPTIARITSGKNCSHPDHLKYYSPAYYTSLSNYCNRCVARNRGFRPKMT
jgi:hypothetical protein